MVRLHFVPPLHTSRIETCKHHSSYTLAWEARKLNAALAYAMAQSGYINGLLGLLLRVFALGSFVIGIGFIAFGCTLESPPKTFVPGYAGVLGLFHYVYIAPCSSWGYDTSGEHIKVQAEAKGFGEVCNIPVCNTGPLLQ